MNHEDDQPTPDEAAHWSRLSIPAFARDWDSDADAVYDDLEADDRGAPEPPDLPPPANCAPSFR